MLVPKIIPKNVKRLNADNTDRWGVWNTQAKGFLKASKDWGGDVYARPTKKWAVDLINDLTKKIKNGGAKIRYNRIVYIFSTGYRDAGDYRRRKK